MKKIYIVISFTGTVLSKIIKCYRHNEFAHVSISLDKELNQLYSFGRLNPNNPFIGGFVHEGINHGTFKKFKNTKAIIYSLNIEDNQYKDIQNIIKTIGEKKEDYKFNVLGLFAVAFNKKITTSNSFYCAEFVKYVLDTANIKTNLPELIKPEDFNNIENLEFEYKGLLKEYTYNINDNQKDLYIHSA